MGRRLPSLSALRSFEAAGRLGRMTLAANELNVTHSAISRQVQALEDGLGVLLFEGSKNAMRLTDAGRALLPGLTQAFDEIERSVSLVSDPSAGPLVVSGIGSFTMRWAIPRLGAFRQLHPDIEIRLIRSEDTVDFDRDGCDVAIRYGPPRWPENSYVTRLFPEYFGPVLAPNASRPASKPFGGLDCLHAHSRPDEWAEWCRVAGQDVDYVPGMAFECFYFMLAAASAGLGVCIAPWPHVSDDIQAGKLVAPLGFVDSGREYVALRSRRRNRKAEMFCNWLKAEAEAFCALPLQSSAA